jgi:hypothetical protein
MAGSSAFSSSRGEVVDPEGANAKVLSLWETIHGRAREAGLPVKAIGGVAVELHARGTLQVLAREYEDVDVVVRRQDRRAVEDLFEAIGLEAERIASPVRQRRQIWWSSSSLHVDVFVGRFEMCHALDLDDRLEGPEPAIAAADLLLTKLQIVELNKKDVLDAGRVLLANDLGEADVEGTINVERLQSVLGNDWGFYTTVRDNLGQLAGALRPTSGADLADELARRADDLAKAIEAAPKSTRFRMRGRLGRRKQWYRLPEEVDQTATAPLGDG